MTTASDVAAIPSLVNWLRGDSANTSTVGAAVSLWDDRTTSNADGANPTSSELPSYTNDPQPGAVWDGSRKMLLSPASASRQVETLFVVAKPTSTSGYRALRGGSGDGASGANELIIINNKLAISRQGIGDTLFSTGTVSANAVGVFTMDFASDSAHLWLNGTASGTVANPALPSANQTTRIGAGYNGGDNFAGSIYELLSFSRVLTATERAAVHSYLSDRYSVTVADYNGTVTTPTPTPTPGTGTGTGTTSGRRSRIGGSWVTTTRRSRIGGGNTVPARKTRLSGVWATIGGAVSGGTGGTGGTTTPVIPSGTSTPARWWLTFGAAPLARATWETGVNSDGKCQVVWVGSFPDVRARTTKLETGVAAQTQAAYQAYIQDLSTGSTVADSGVVTDTAEKWVATSFTPVAGRRYKGFARVRANDGQWSAYASTRFVAPSGVVRYFEDYGAVGDGTTRSGTDYSNNIFTGPIRDALKACNPGDVVRSKNPGTVIPGLTATGTTLAATTAVFTQAMAGKKVIIYGAGSKDASTNSNCHRTTISAVSSDLKSCTLAAAVTTGGTGLTAVANYAEYWTGHMDMDAGMGAPGNAGGWTLDGTGCVFTSLDVDKSGFRTIIPDVTYRNVHYWQKVQTTRGNGLNGNTGPFFIESAGAIGIRVIGCYAERARDAGFLLYNNPSDVHIVDCVTDHCNADPFHVTGSGHDIQFIRPRAIFAGDDVVANIGYRSDGDSARPYNITWESPRMEGQDWGRGLSFGGCFNILATDVVFDGGAMAAFLIGSDGDQANTNNVQVRRFTVTNPNVKRGTKPTYTQGANTNSTIADDPWLKLLNSSSPTAQRDILMEDGTVNNGRYIQFISYGNGPFNDASIILRGITMTGTVNAGSNWLDQGTYNSHIDARGISVPSGSTPASAPTNPNS